MDRLKLLLSILLLTRSNLQVLHWKCHGKAFDTIHKVCDELISDKIDPTIDLVGEVMVTAHLTPVSVVDAIKVVEEDDSVEFAMLEADADYDYDKAKGAIKEMLNNIIKLIREILEDIEKDLDDDKLNAKISLEESYKSLMNAKYLNSRRFDD